MPLLSKLKSGTSTIKMENTNKQLSDSYYRGPYNHKYSYRKEAGGPESGKKCEYEYERGTCENRSRVRKKGRERETAETGHSWL